MLHFVSGINSLYLFVNLILVPVPLFPTHLSGASKPGGITHVASWIFLVFLGGRKNSVTLYTVSDCEFYNLIIINLMII